MKFSFFRKKHAATLHNAPPPSKRRWKVVRTQLLVFFGLFLAVEIVLRIFGFKPGVAQDFYYQRGDVVYDSVLYADEAGITHLVSTGVFARDQVINREGFHSEIEFTPEAMDSVRATGKKIVLLVGDSYTQGCCPYSYTQSFAYLLNKSGEYEVLNFGIGGTDPLHYELVVKKYAPILKPDLVSVAVYLGNDEMAYDRTAKPYIPVCYPVKEGHWLSSEAYVNVRPPNTYFKNFGEARDFFYTYYSLNGDNAIWYERMIRPSIILSRIYLYFKIKREEGKMVFDKKLLPDKPPFTYNHLQGIQDFCDSLHIPVVFSAIPSPPDIADQVNIRKNYAHFFKTLKWDYVKGIKPEDYNGSSVAAHFVESGHRKFARYLKRQYDNVLK